MRQKGRAKGAQGTEDIRPEPPNRLDEARAATWRSITATQPADWFPTGTLPVLEAYVNRIHAIAAMEATLQEALAAPADKRDLALLLGAAQFLRAEIGTLRGLATSLRMTPQSASSNSRSQKPEKTLPWQTAEQDAE